MSLQKFDELNCLIQGIHHIDRHNLSSECYYYANAADPSKCEKTQFDFRDPYPYLVVNIGSGVSILEVRSSTDFQRISGTR